MRCKTYNNDMKKLTLILLILFSAFSLRAEVGESCGNPIPVDMEYSGSFPAGEYWFTATTDALPLTIYYYPEDTTVGAPEVWIDLTCTSGVYEDTLVAKMVQTAGQYHLSFPMREVPDKQYDENGQLYYSIVYDRNYRDMLYNQGVTYSIPAYVRLVNPTQASVDIVSTSVNARCREYVNTLGLNTSLRVVPADSVYVHLWPLGEWINKTYRITWQGEGNMEFVDGKDCLLSHYSRVYQNYNLIDDTLTVRPRLASDWIKDIYQTDFYVRLFAQNEGVLKIEEFQEVSRLIEVIIGGVSAAIDHDALTITVVLPAGTTKAQIIKAVKNAEIHYEAYNGEKPAINNTANKLTFGDKTYKISATVAPSAGNSDATLSSITVDGYPLDGFLASTLEYTDVEVTTTVPVVEAQPTVLTSSVKITPASSLPGTATIVVTAEAGNTQTYTLHLIAGRSRDASLASLTIDGKPFPLTEGETSYRTAVTKLPVVEATATDPAATVLVEQAKGVPGFAQVRVTAEAGNVQNYTFSFVMDSRFEPCLEATPSLTLGEPVALSVSQPDAVYNIPVKDWAEQHIRFSWDADADLMVYAGTSCFFDPTNPDETLLDSFLLAIPKGETSRHFDFRPADLRDLAHRSLDGTLYLRFRILRDGNLTLTEWTENCLTQSVLLDLPSRNTIVADARGKYKIYLPDWKNKMVQLKWEGISDVTMFVADDCNFYLTPDNIHVLQPSPFSFAAGKDSLTITPEITSLWNYSADGGFVYVRFVNDVEGVLSLMDITEHSGETALIDQDADSWYCYRLDAGWQVVAKQPVKLTVYTLTGTLLQTICLQPDVPVLLSLPQGVFVLRTMDEVKKLIN